MNDPVQDAIPPSMFHWLAAVPDDRPVALLVRHSVRDELPRDDVGYELPLNALGVQLARSLGAAMHGRVRTLRTSPVSRCVQTAGLIGDAAGAALQIVPDRMLGDPGAYVIDRRLAGRNWLAMGSRGIMEHLAFRDDPLPGTEHPDAGARKLVRHMLQVAVDVPGLHVFVTHDILLAATAARFLGPPQGPQPWPRYLEGAFFWRDEDGLKAAYRDACRSGLSETAPPDGG
ncbi:histidine phosphatase family protein [Thauera sinica]|uniref:Histidine phosphatase family protein n=1 Tax=Thauera sinica TaxID=2665146 RepID=A0ABW1AYM6_9RHOO|nr:histidine phosphatase family protein [Thauera sp. K11]ATE58630.1 histidine phosphatase family protein [Thauera sp. K11]